MKNLILTLLLIGLIPLIGSAKCTTVAKVKYEANYGWSKLYTVDVTFMSGSELNSTTSTFNYSPYNVYAIIFWNNDQATVIKLTLTTISNVTCSFIENQILDLQGYDQDGDKWNVCLKSICF